MTDLRLSRGTYCLSSGQPSYPLALSLPFIQLPLPPLPPPPPHLHPPWWGIPDAEIKVGLTENPGLSEYIFAFSPTAINSAQISALSVCNLRQDGIISRGTSHATTTERYQHTTSVQINNTRYKRIQSLIQNRMRHVRSESAREQRIALYKSYE